MLPRSVLFHVSLLALLGGCAAALAAPPASRALSESDSGRSLVLSVGDRFAVKMRSTPGTGYTWEVVGGDPGVVAERPPRTSKPAGPERPGSAVVETISFAARGPGTTRLVLAYHRPWEREAAPARTFVLDVTVR